VKEVKRGRLEYPLVTSKAAPLDGDAKTKTENTVANSSIVMISNQQFSSYFISVHDTLCIERIKRTGRRHYSGG